MRIAIDCRKIADFGIGTYVRGLVTGLAGLEGPEDYVLLVPRSAERLPRQFEQVVVDVPNYSIRELYALRRALDRTRADVFHAPHFVLPWDGRPSLVTIHDVIPFHFPPSNPAARLYLATMIPRALRKSARVLTVSEAAKEAIVGAFDCPAGKIVVTPNGIDEIFFSETIPPQDLGRYVLFAGNDKPHKNVAALVTALAIVRRHDPSLRLVLAGGSYTRFASSEGVIPKGFVTPEELVGLYRGALALVLPSFEEGFGLPAVEAMAAGTPVVAADIPALREVCGDAAVFVDPSSPAEIAAGIAQVAGDAGLRDALRVRGLTRARQYTWRRCAELTRKAYLSATHGV